MVVFVLWQTGSWWGWRPLLLFCGTRPPHVPPHGLPAPASSTRVASLLTPPPTHTLPCRREHGEAAREVAGPGVCGCGEHLPTSPHPPPPVTPPQPPTPSFCSHHWLIVGCNLVPDARKGAGQPSCGALCGMGGGGGRDGESELSTTLPSCDTRADQANPEAYARAGDCSTKSHGRYDRERVAYVCVVGWGFGQVWTLLCSKDSLTIQPPL